MARPHDFRTTFRIAVLLAAGTSCGAQVTETDARSIRGTFVSDSVTFGYTMDIPPGKGPFPVFAFVHGSGRTTRDEMLNILPQFLTRGFAVLRYDKRGVGESGGLYEGVGPLNSPRVIPQLARDAQAAFATACSAPNINRQRCGFFGASQAGWVIAEALSNLPSAAFAVIFSGTTSSVGREIAYSNVVETGGGTIDSAYAVWAAYTGPEGYDPAAALAQGHTPMLWLVGLDDHSIPSRTTVTFLHQLAALGHPFTVRAFEGYGHGLGPLIWPAIDDFFLTPPVARDAVDSHGNRRSP